VLLSINSEDERRGQTSSPLSSDPDFRFGSCARTSVGCRSRGTSDRSVRYCGRSRLEVYYELCIGRCLSVKAGAREIRDPAMSGQRWEAAKIRSEAVMVPSSKRSTESGHAQFGGRKGVMVTDCNEQKEAA
jgi:hypothetical protein